MLLPYNMRVSSWLSMISGLLLSASLMPPVGAPPVVSQCPLEALIKGTGDPPPVKACVALINCDDTVELWRFSEYNTPGFNAVADVPARPPEKIGVDMIDEEKGDLVLTKVELLWSLPPMTYDTQGFVIIAKGYNNGSVKTTCRLIKISPNTTETYDDVMFRFPIPSLDPDADYSIALLSAPVPPAMPADSSKAWMILKVRNNSKSDGNWRPNVMVQRLDIPGELKIQFSIRPAFRVYEIATLNTETNEQRMVVHDVGPVNQTQSFLVVTRLYRGIYQVMVRPYNDPNMCVCYNDGGNCSDVCPETLTMNFIINEEEPPMSTTVLLHSETSDNRTTALDLTTRAVPDEVLTPEATRSQEEFVLSTTTNDPLNMMPSTIQRTNNSLIGGLIGGLVAAGLFSFIVVVFAVLDKPPPPRKSKVSTN